MKLSKNASLVALNLAVALAYTGAGVFGLWLGGTVKGNVTLLWPPTGIALAAAYVFGLRIWPGLIVGAFAATASTGAPLGFALVTALGNPLPAVVTVLVVRRWRAAQTTNFRDMMDAVLLIAIGAVCTPVLSAGIGVVGLVANGMIPTAIMGPVFTSWYVGDAVGAAVLAPVLIALANRERAVAWRERAGEVLGLVLCTLCFFWLLASKGIEQHELLVIAAFPLIIWSALRFSVLSTSLLALLIDVLLVGALIIGMRATDAAVPGIEIFNVQLMVMTVSATGLILAMAVAERRRAESRLQLAASVFSHASEAIVITAPDGGILDVNEAFTHITAYSRAEVLGQNPRLLNSGRQAKGFYVNMWRSLMAKGHWEGEMWNRRKGGEVFVTMQSINAVKDVAGKTSHYVSLFSDITYTKQYEAQLKRLAHYDSLTDLPNRVLLADRLQQDLIQAHRRKQRLAVAFLDLDNFKTINDRHGHEVGDSVLIAVTGRMKQVLRPGDTLARIGGDEFVAVLLDLEDLSSSHEVFSSLIAVTATPVQVGDLQLLVSASMGVTFSLQNEDVTPEVLLRQADQAMYQAKLSGKNRYHVFDVELDRSARTHNESLARINAALNGSEFVLHYQPKVNMRSGKIIGVEALIRWQHPQDGLLSPAAFLPTIEEHPLAISVGEWVIDAALKQLAQWQAAGLDLTVSVNIGARQLQQDDFVERLKFILAMHPHVAPSRLELEVLETSALADMAQVSRVIEECAKMGVLFALDDFGTGYSSLTYLKRLDVALLKIDQSFVRDMLHDPDDMAILRGVIGLANALRRQVIAEGVETIEQGTQLLRLGCELAQGYCIARPMPGDQLLTWAGTWRPNPAWSAA